METHTVPALSGSSPQFRSRGFWICIVVLLGIFSVLASGSVRLSTDINQKAARTLQIANSLELALTGYDSEYGHLPSSAAPAILSAGPGAVSLLNTLAGKNSSADNPRLIPLLALPEGRANRNGLIYDAATRDITGLYDSWGQPYRLYIDTTRSGTIRLPSGKTITGKLAVIVSDGRDGKAGTSDDVVSGEPLASPGLMERLLR